MRTLFHYPLCPYSRSIRLALAECGVAIELEQQTPWAWGPEILELNPAGSLPVLQDDEGHVICGAYAISEYLSDCGEDTGPGGGAFSFFPGDEAERAEVRRLTDWFHRKMNDEVTAYLLVEKVNRRFDPDLVGSPEMEAIRAGRANLRYHLGYIGHLADERNWLAGEELSFADLAAAAHLSCIDYLGDVPWGENASAKQWYARIKSRPSFRALLDDKVIGLTPPEIYADPDF